MVTVNLATPASTVAAQRAGRRWTWWQPRSGSCRRGALQICTSPQAAIAIAGVIGVVVVGLFSLVWPKAPDAPATSSSPRS
jgi:hypothetical protein